MERALLLSFKDVAMKEKSIPAPESLAAHEQAAAKITELRRKGIHCHLEDRPSEGGPCIDVMVDPQGPAGEEKSSPFARPKTWRRRAYP